jgi:dolichol-phosphate mannosyltransferase
MKVSVVLPTYNEAGNIVELVRTIAREVQPTGWNLEVIVVDDNSPDGTYQIVEEAFREDPAVSPVLRTEDRSLARSIWTGIRIARGDKILVMDTDFTHDPSEIPKMLHVSEVYDIVSGSRFCAGGNMQSVTHYIASFLYNFFIRVVLNTQVQDNLGGFFVMSRNKLEMLPWDRIFFGHGDYFFRLLQYAQRNYMSIVEVPANYSRRRRGSSKSNFLGLLFSYTRAVLQLRREAGPVPAYWRSTIRSKAG